MVNRRLFVFAVAIVSAIAVGSAAGYLLHSLWDIPEVRMLEEFKPAVTSRIYTENGSLLAEFYLENRTPIRYEDVPQTLVQALIAAEDTRFFSHHGLDFRGIIRALYRNVRARRITEGGSTLTQQLAKVLFLNPERSYSRKLKEMALALKIEQRYTKQEILSFYLNQIYFGAGAYGVEAAAQTYFGKSAKDMSVAECALLAGLPRSPNTYSPFKSRENAFTRRAYVLRRMLAVGVITKQQCDEAMHVPLPLQPTVKTNGRPPAPYFVEYIRQKIEERFGSGVLYSGGLNVYTSISDTIQQYAREAVTKGLEQLELHNKRAHAAAPLQAALIAIDPSTGFIRAMVGGRDYSESQFNRAWQAMRQPGSAFKPIVYAAALDRGYSAADILDDAPLTVKLDNVTSWSPENFSKTFHGPVTLRRALAQSLNIPTVRLLMTVGIPKVIDFARRLGIRSQLKPVPSLALGSSDTTLQDLTGAYAVFADHGIRMEPGAILSIKDTSGRVLYSHELHPVQAIKPETAYLITNLLRGVIEQGTGWQARALQWPTAGKTGTTNDYRDAWFIGYTPVLVAGVWVGYDEQRSIGPRATGASVALPIWLDFMLHAHAGQETIDFNVPNNIVFKNIDPRSGLLATGACKMTIREAFISGTEPRKYCEESWPEKGNILQNAPTEEQSIN